VPGKAIDITGQTFGRLTAIEPAGQNASRGVMWRCQCDCGSEAVVAGSSLRNGHTRSCGCLHDELAVVKMAKLGASSRTHGQSHERRSTYATWQSMLQRTRDPERIYYAARGITVCDRWEPKRGGSFENFLADMGERPDGMSIDRIDSAGNYTPDNCRWATQLQQQHNRRGVTKLLVRARIVAAVKRGEPRAAIATKYGVSVKTVWNHAKRAKRRAPT
jgi:DNA-binding CsgD family transcriptional regulator